MKKFLYGFGIIVLCLFAYSLYVFSPRRACFYDICLYLPSGYIGKYFSESDVGGGDIQEVAIFHQDRLVDKPNQEMLITIAKCDIGDDDMVSARDFMRQQAIIEEKNNQAGNVPITGLGLPMMVELRNPQPNIDKSNLIELAADENIRCNDYRLKPNREDKRMFMFVANNVLYELVYYPSLFDKEISEKILGGVTVK